MSTSVYKTQGTFTTSAGSAVGVINASHSILMWLYINPTTPTTTYNVVLKDAFDNHIYIREDEAGRFSREVAIPSYGNWSLHIDSASADEEFYYLLAFKEI